MGREGGEKVGVYLGIGAWPSRQRARLEAMKFTRSVGNSIELMRVSGRVPLDD